MAKKRERFTFKKGERETGLAAMVYRPSTDIKYKKKKVGSIRPPSCMDKEHVHRVMLMVNSNEDNGGWHWVTLKKRFESEQDARDYLRQEDVVNRLLKLNLHSFED